MFVVATLQDITTLPETIRTTHSTVFDIYL